MISVRLLCNVLALAIACGGGKTAPPAAPATPAPAEAASPATPAAPPGERPHFTTFDIQDNALVLPRANAFSASGELDVAASTQALWCIHDYLEAKPYITLVRLEGHSDQPGRGRGEGITCDRMLVSAFGNTKPRADGSTPEGRAQNRRIEVVNASLKGRPIGGMPVDGSAPASAPCL